VQRAANKKEKKDEKIKFYCTDNCQGAAVPQL
jgi:hypothetical protein